jgi:hypothetical protein
MRPRACLANVFSACGVIQAPFDAGKSRAEFGDGEHEIARSPYMLKRFMFPELGGQATSECRC